jgi:hypothetical protein
MLDRKTVCILVAGVNLLAATAALSQTRGQVPLPPLKTNPVPLCFPQTDGGIAHSTNVNAGSVETWDMAGGPHQVTGDISVYGLLTINPCTVVRIAAGSKFQARSDALW